MARPIVIAAGGTGGHFFPAEALAMELVARGHRIALMTDARSGGLNSDVFKGREQFILRGAGIAGRGVLKGMQAFINIVVNLGLAPTKGMTLPFISYGGSSMLAMGLTLGMALALTRRQHGAYATETLAHEPQVFG